MTRQAAHDPPRLVPAMAHTGTHVTTLHVRRIPTWIPRPWRARRRRVVSKQSGRATLPGHRAAKPLVLGVRVDEVPNRGQFAPQVLVARGFLVDLVAGVEHGGVVAPAQLGADPE